MALGACSPGLSAQCPDRGWPCCGEAKLPHRTRVGPDFLGRGFPPPGSVRVAPPVMPAATPHCGCRNGMCWGIKGQREAVLRHKA